MATKTFKEAYGVLQNHAKTLRDQQDPNIDDLLKIVTESVDAYNVCKERIQAVEQALEKALSDTGAAPTAPTRAVTPSQPSSPTAPAFDMDDDGDIPF